MFTFLKRKTADPGPDALIHLASPTLPPNSKDTLKVIGEHLPKDTALLLAPLSEDLGISEVKTKRSGSERIFQPETPHPLHFPRLQGNQIDTTSPLALREG